MNKDVRTEWVDYAKAIGIVLVVYGHVARGLYEAGIWSSESVFRLVDSIIYSFHMPLFFFLSGLFFYQSFSKRGGVNLTLSKIDTIAYPYVVWTFVQGGLNVFLSRFTNSNVSLLDVLAIWTPYAQFWFLYALFFIFIVTTLIYAFLPKRFSILFLLFSAFFYLNRWILPDVAISIYLAGGLVFFVLGIVFSNNGVERYLSSSTSLAVSSLVFLTSQYWFHIYSERVYSDVGAATLCLAIVSILFICSVSLVLSRRPNNLIVLIGTSSMGIYVMHILAGSGIRVILQSFFGINSATIHLFVGVLAGLLLPLIAIKLIDKLGVPFVFSAPISKILSIGKRSQLT